MTTEAATIDATDADGFEPIGTATYSVEDNKLRLYPFARLDAATYERVKAAGFQWAPKQECFVAARWTPSREDLLLELCGEIDDEDYSATERAADRAERFGDYRDKRAAEAGASADKFGSGPSAFGHQSRARVERQARRHDRHRIYAVSQWSKAEYWQSRTEGVIANALHRADHRTRRGRIKSLEAEQRKNEKERAEYAERFALWSNVPTMDGADRPGEYESTSDRCGFKPESVTPALRLAYQLANYGSYGDYTHPRTGRQASLYSLLTDAADPITPAEAAALWLAGRRDPADPGTSFNRWAAHYENRLTYERAMLANEGGTAADAEIVAGGWVNGGRVVKVNKSAVTGKVVSVRVLVDGKERVRNVERLPEGAYRAPTAEELEAFAAEQAERKAVKKATTPKSPALINPTDADAERLQALWNAKAGEKFAAGKAEGRYHGEYTPTKVRRMTQAEYSAKSGGSYTPCETVEVCTDGHRQSRWHDYGTAKRATAFKVRKTYSGSSWSGAADAVIVITDKPQKPLPLDWDAIAAGTVEQGNEQPAGELVTA